MKKIVLLILVLVSLSGCEKDDICIEDTTPRLIVEFYDISSSALKNVVSLKVKGEGALNDLDLGTFNGVSKIELPLNPGANITKYSLILNSASTSSDPNEDFLQFNYTTKTVYVSRACGYKTIFELNNLDGVELTDAVIADTKWIQNLTVETTSITSENETHIKIYF